MVYKFNINNRDIPLEIDSGACASLLNRKDCDNLGLNVTPTSRKLSAYGGKEIKLLGEVSVKVCFDTQYVKHTFYVPENISGNLCGRDLMIKLNIGLTNVSDALRVNSICQNKDISDILNDYVVCEENPIKNVEAEIFLKDNACPKYFKARTVPHAQRDLVNDALDKLLEDGTIEPVAFSNWVSPIVPVLNL